MTSILDRLKALHQKEPNTQIGAVGMTELFRKELDFIITEIEAAEKVKDLDRCQFHGTIPSSKEYARQCWGELWECSGCRQIVCAGSGAADAYPDLCDICANKKINTDKVYAERNQLVAGLARLALSKGWKAGVGVDPEAEEADWQTVVFIDLPTGQVSWHFHSSERHLLDGLPFYGKPWDKHSNTQKYERLNALAGYMGWDLVGPKYGKEGT